MKNKISISTTILAVWFMGILAICMVFAAVVYTPKNERIKSIWQEGDQVIFKLNGPRMLVIDPLSNTCVICEYFDYITGRFVIEHFKDNALERINNENNK